MHHLNSQAQSQEHLDSRQEYATVTHDVVPSSIVSGMQTITGEGETERVSGARNLVQDLQKHDEL